MRRFLLSSALALTCGLPASAQSMASDFAAEVRGISSARHDRYSVNPAGEELLQLIGQSVSADHASTWGRWMGNEYLDYDEYYASAIRNLDEWASALRFGEVDIATAEAVLPPAMERLRAMDARMERQIAEAYSHVRVRAFHFGTAVRLGSTGPNCVAYHRHMEQAARAWARAYASLPSELQYAEPIPPVAGYADAETALREVLPTEPVSLSDYGQRLEVMHLLLEQRGVTPDDPLLQALQMLATHAEGQAHADQAAVLLEELAEAGEGRVDRALDAQIALLERAATILPDMVASLAAQDRPLTAEDIRPLYDFAVRAEQLRADTQNPIALPSNLLRNLSGLRAAMSGLQIAEGDADARQYVSVVQDIAQAATGQVPVTAAFALPSGIVAGHLDWQVEGLNAISNTMDAVAEAIRSGDPQAFQRAIALSEDVRRTIHPGRIAQHWLRGAASGWASNLPFGRALLGELAEALGPMEDEEPEGDSEGASGHCY